MENGDVVRCNENHLFETQLGWATAKECESFGCIGYLTKSGIMRGIVESTNRDIPIVDIKVDHPNHRYYTNNVSSHNTGGGKSLAMCSMAASYLRQGYNVLYITLELSEERVAERIDANLLNIPIQSLRDVEQPTFLSKIEQLKSKTHGILKIKEYPMSSVSATTFSALIDTYQQKENFLPDVIIVDYLGVTCSSMYKGATNVNTYSVQKAVAEELRAMGTTYNAIVWTALQTNRSGFNASDFDLENISDSSGPAMASDTMWGIIRTSELDETEQLILKQLKNRFGDPNVNKKFIVGVDRSKMRLYNIEQTDQSSASRSIEPVTIKKPQNDVYPNTKKQFKSDGWCFE